MIFPYVWYRYYSLEVVQHPIRARMCGFGDKVRLQITSVVNMIDIPTP